MVKEGAAAPQFSVKDHFGKVTTLNDFKGKTVILWFYPKADTPGCTAEGCGFRDRIEKFKQANVEVLGVSFDTVEENMAFAKKFGFPFRLLCDTNREIGLAYGACKDQGDEYAQRIGYVIDAGGKVRKAYPKVDAKSFPETVLAELH